MEEFIVAAAVDSLEGHHQERLRLRTIRDASDPFQIEEEKFRKLFRVPKSGARQLIDQLNVASTSREGIPKHIEILSALQFFAQGSYQAAVGQDNFLGVSQPTVSRCLDATVNAIVSHGKFDDSGAQPTIIKFPMTPSDKQSAMTDFQEMFGMPNTLGAVDGTHIAIAKPPLSHPTAPGNLYYNRKGFYSINCQIVCSAKGKIIGLNPNYPGSTHDAAIWRASDIHRYLRNEFVRGARDQWVLGDKGYPLEPWLMTPLMEPTTPSEIRYNACHVRARNVVEMCNGRLKNKFRCLHRHRCLHYEPQKAAKIILSCCVLYNMFSDAFNDNDENDTEEELLQFEPAHDGIPETDGDEDQDFLSEARSIRQNLITRF